MKKNLLFAGAICSSIVIFDQLTKFWIKAKLPTYFDKISLIQNHLDLIHRKNPGAAFSLFASAKSAPLIFAIISALALAFIAYTIYKNNKLPMIAVTSLAFIAGGAAGNLVDRLIPPHKVIDFIDFYVGKWHWPAFNIADSAITIGACLLAITIFFFRDPFEKNEKN